MKQVQYYGSVKKKKTDTVCRGYILRLLDYYLRLYTVNLYHLHKMSIFTFLTKLQPF